MKTEKRLTMALSVLVALMMLAVPLASSSNLFVDGGQTNSNGDAPLLGAAGDTLTINLNIPENSLDSVSKSTLKTTLDTLIAGEGKFNSKLGGKIVFSVDGTDDFATGIRVTSIIDTDNAAAKVTDVLDAVKEALATNGVADSRNVAYTFSITGVTYDNTTVISDEMTATVNWTLKGVNSTYEKGPYGFTEVTINTTGLEENLSFIKAYAYADEKRTSIKIDTLPDNLESAGNGYVVNVVKPVAALQAGGDVKVYGNNKPVYDYTVSDSNGNNVDKEKVAIDGVAINAGASITAAYTFNSLEYSTLIVNSPIFNENIKFYVAKTTGALQVANTTYWMVFNALVAEEYLTNVKDSKNNEVKPFTDVPAQIETPFTANNGTCKINSWTNGSEDYALNSNSTISVGSELTLNAEFTTFSVLFMVKGQAQSIEVKYGDFSEASCPFDTTGMTAWVTPSNDGYSLFNFDRPADELQSALTSDGLTLIALFSDYNNTEYVTFNAGTDAYFDADKKIDTIIVPVAKGTTADKIPVPVNPISTSNSEFFAFWTETVNDITAEYKFTNSVTVDESIELTAEFINYAYSVTLKVNDAKYMTIYLSAAVDAGASISDNVSGVEFDGKVYTSTNIASVSENETLSSFIMENMLPSLSGYDFIQYNDSDGNKALNITIDAVTGKVTAVTSVSKIGANVEFDAIFEAADYVIIYSGNTAAATNNMVQVGTVGEPLNFFSDATFSNDGYKLKEWNTRPDGKGTSYALGSSFTLNGEQFKGLSDVSKVDNVPAGITNGFTLYAIWEKVGSSGSGSGDNNEGNDGNNTDTYLLAGILAVIIILIILIAFLMRRKQ